MNSRKVTDLSLAALGGACLFVGLMFLRVDRLNSCVTLIAGIVALRVAYMPWRKRDGAKSGVP